MRFFSPNCKKHRSLEKESIDVTRPAQAIKQALRSIANQNKIEWLRALAAQLQEAIMHRS
jgi:hypothetical protein